MARATEARRTWREIRSHLLSDVEELLAARLERVEWRDAQRAGEALGRVAWRLSRRDRERTLRHLEIAFPELPEPERVRIARASFAHFGALLAECLWLRSRPTTELDARVEISGWEHVEAARAERRPVLVLTGHCGNWEMLAAALNRRGLGMAVVARELDDPLQQSSLLAFRARFGTETIVRGRPGAARALLSTLRGGGALGMLIDQDTTVDGVWVEFFGRSAWTPVGAAELAARFGAAVLPTFVERRADGGHLATIGAPLDLPADPTESTRRMTEAIEAQVRRVPEQWVWMHRRWRRRPPGETP